MKKPERLDGVDGWRGVAIIAMVVYHFLFDVQFLNIFPVPIQSLPLVIFQRSIGTLFLVLLGVSIVLSAQKNPSYFHFVSSRLAGDCSGGHYARNLGLPP